jgi:hypothetical protein
MSNTIRRRTILQTFAAGLALAARSVHGIVNKSKLSMTFYYLKWLGE